EDGLLLAPGSEHLGGGHATVLQDDRIREGPAHVDAEHSHSGRLTAWQSVGSSSTSTVCSSTPRLPPGSSGRSSTASMVMSSHGTSGPRSSGRSALPSIHSVTWKSS